MMSQGFTESKSQSLVVIGEFIVNLDITSRSDIKKMRNYFPQKEYLALKNRKTARMQRMKNKQASSEKQTQFTSLLDINTSLKQENAWIRQRIAELEAQLGLPKIRMLISLPSVVLPLENNKNEYLPE